MRPRFSTFASLVVGLFLATQAGPAAARPPVRQVHEVRANVDVTAAQKNSYALVELAYTFTPASIDRNDVVVPPLRRFVRHPSSLGARVYRDGSNVDKLTGAEIGGVLQLLDGRLYGAATAGFEQDQVQTTDVEDGYLAAPLRLEIGGRPLNLLSLGAYGRFRPIVDATDGANVPIPARRSGRELEFGGTIGFATPNDRLLGSLSAGYYLADWDFTGFHPGPLDVRGLHGALLLSAQSSASISFQLRVRGEMNDWDNRRDSEELDMYVERDLERRAYTIEGDLGFTYWFRGEVAFRVSLGGGFRSEPPIYYRAEDFGGDTGIARLGLGLISRF